MLEGYERVAAWESPYRTDARVTVAEHDPYATQRDVGVDLAAELTEMIVAQRDYTANSKVVQTGSELLDVLVNLKR